jgi:hypothetical protein
VAIIAQRDGVGVEMEITGMKETLQALSLVDPEMYKQFRKRLGLIGKTIAGTAQRKAPSRTGQMRGGYTARLRDRGRVSLVTASNKTRQGAILEFAGSRSAGKPGQGASLVASLTRDYGKTGRFLWDAHDLLEPWIESQFLEAAEQAERDLQAALDKTGK